MALHKDDPMAQILAKIEEGNKETHRLIGDIQMLVNTAEETMKRLTKVLVLIWLTSVNNRTKRKRGRSHPVSLGIGSTEPIRECLDREANLSPLGSALGLQCL